MAFERQGAGQHAGSRAVLHHNAWARLPGLNQRQERTCASAAAAIQVRCWQGRPFTLSNGPPPGPDHVAHAAGGFNAGGGR